MKVRERWKYISYRTNILFGLLFGLCSVLIFILAIFSFTNQSTWFLPFLFSGLLFGSAMIFYYYCYKPAQETNKIFDLFAKGYLLQDAFEVSNPFTKELEDATQKFRQMLNTKDLISVSKKQAEYLALQNQINPHFLYNTLEGIRGEALIEGMDQIAEMTEALATFFRYTISQVEQLVTLEDELANIENYYMIQQFRFGDRLNLKIEYELNEKYDILGFCLPKLTLQPIVENSIFHGIERKIGKGMLKITIRVSDCHLIIRVSDDGMGMAQERLNQLNERLRKLTLDDVDPNRSQQGGIAILNVSNRIKLLFGEEYGIHIYSTQKVGTDVEITLPLVEQPGG